MSWEPELSKYTVDDLLNEIATRCNGELNKAEIADLVYELSTRKDVDVTMVDKGNVARLRVVGPAVVLTVFD